MFKAQTTIFHQTLKFESEARELIRLLIVLEQFSKKSLEYRILLLLVDLLF